MTATALVPKPSPEVDTLVVDRVASHHAHVARLSHSSVVKHFDAYADIDWEAPEHRIDPEDPRFERPADCGLGRTQWYRDQPAAVRARLGLQMLLVQLRVGIDFENILSRGLLEFATTLSPGAPDLRYALHEIAEEAQHTMMFQELVARSHLPATGLTGFEAWASRRVPTFGRTFPAFFFLHVLGGEAPIDHAQRIELKRRDALHPLFRRVMQIHVTEEARHISFAKSWLVANAPRLSAWEMFQLRVHTPFTLAVMAKQMVEPPKWLLDVYGVPREVRREAFVEDAEHRRRFAEGLAPVRELCAEIGIITPALVPVWRMLGLWPTEAPLPRLSPST